MFNVLFNFHFIINLKIHLNGKVFNKRLGKDK